MFAKCRRILIGLTAGCLATVSAAQNPGAVVASPPKRAQPAPAPSTFNALAARIAAIEQRLTALETRVTNDEAAVQPYSADDSNPGASQSDKAQLAALKARVDELAAEVARSAQGNDIGSRVTAPFEVVDGKGRLIMRVQGGDSGGNGLKSGVYVSGANSQWISLGTNDSDVTGIRFYAGEIGDSRNVKAAMGLQPDGNGALLLSSKEGLAVRLRAYASGEGEAQFLNRGGSVVAAIGGNPDTGTGHAVFSGSDGDWLLKLGANGTHGDAAIRGDGHAFLLWDALVLGLVK